MNEYKAVGCSPCDKTMWKMLKAIERGWIAPHGTKADSHLFDHLRGYKTLEEIPCCLKSECQR